VPAQVTAGLKVCDVALAGFLHATFTADCLCGVNTFRKSKTYTDAVGEKRLQAAVLLEAGPTVSRKWQSSVVSAVQCKASCSLAVGL